MVWSVSEPIWSGKGCSFYSRDLRKYTVITKNLLTLNIFLISSDIFVTDLHFAMFFIDRFIVTIFPRINAAAFIKFFIIWVQRLFEGGVYSRVAIFKMLFIFLNNQP